MITSSPGRIHICFRPGRPLKDMMRAARAETARAVRTPLPAKPPKLSPARQGWSAGYYLPPKRPEKLTLENSHAVRTVEPGGVMPSRHPTGYASAADTSE